jgi:hypothetical protein
MFKGTKVIFIIYLFSSAGLYAQSLSQVVMVPPAGIAVKDGKNYQHTIGETAVELFNLSDYKLTQGFQQPRFIEPIGVQNQGTGVEVYPNPAVEYLELKLFGETARKFRIDLINFAGSVLKTETLEFTGKYFYIERWDAGEFKPGFYIIRVVSEDGVISRSFKIEKV